ncbi:MAG TPA: hypothetical protein VF230_16895 [Acidimicrobiales bacterium]
MKVRALVAAVAVALTTLVVAAPPATAAAGVVVCAVAGTVDVQPGVGRIPPGSNTDGGYTFNQVALVCVGANDNPLGQGTMTGVGTTVSSTGMFGQGNCDGVDYPLVGSFCGTYDASNFTLGGECHGTVGGNEMAMADEPPPGPPLGSWGDEDTIDEQIAAGDWSVTFGPVILGGITCDTGSYDDSPGGVLDNVADHDGVGVIALVAAPMPTSIASRPSLNLPGTCTEPNPLVADPAAVWFCQIAIAGVVVMESLGATPAAMGVVDTVTDTLPPILP